MDSILYAQWFSESLEGSSCLISRKHCPKEILRPENYFTLHQIAYKVLKKSSSRFELSGNLMFNSVQKALTKVFGEFPSFEKSLMYYYLIRDHKIALSQLIFSPDFALYSAI